MTLALSILDYSEESIDDTIATARLAESLGYRRYWLAEHFENRVHASTMIVSGLVAAATRTLRVGPSGVLIRYQHPLHVANAAALLHNQFPDRIDFGMAGGVGGKEVRAYLLEGQAPSPSEYLERGLRVRDLLAGRGPVPTHPAPRSPVNLWMLSSSGHRAEELAKEGFSLGVSYLHTPEPPHVDAFRRYRDAYASFHDQPPRTCLCVAVACAPTEKEALETSEPYQKPEGARFRLVWGTPTQCREKLGAIAATYAVDEMALLDCTSYLEDRDDSFRLLARAFELAPPALSAAAGGAAGGPARS